MVATLYTAVPLPFEGMRNRIHKKDPQGILGRNLTAAFKKRGLSARSVALGLQSSYGLNVSNKTVSNLLNGEGNPQLDNLMAVARYINIPLWQLLCPAVEISHLDDLAVHSLLEDYFSLSPIGRKRAQRNLKGEAALEQVERADRAKNDAESVT